MSVSVLVSLGWIGRTHADDGPTKSVRMVIAYGDGVEKHFTQLPWNDGMTVLDALKAAAQHPRGITFKYRGKGATAFLTQIDDLKNEGRQRNWIFRVNSKLADRSFGIVTLKPGDAVLWKFGEYR
jgi:hypothetical protein